MNSIMMTGKSAKIGTDSRISNTGNKIASNAVRGNNIVAGTITGNLIGVSAITGNLIANNTITGNAISTPADIFDDAFLFGGM